MIEHYGDIRRNTFFIQLVNLNKKGSVIEHINQFQLSLKVKNISEDNLLDLFIGTLKDNIQHEVRLFDSPTSLEKDFMMVRKVENKNIAMNTRKAFSNTYREDNVPSPKQTQRFTLQQLDERREKGLCFNCDSKYSKGHK